MQKEIYATTRPGRHLLEYGMKKAGSRKQKLCLECQRCCKEIGVYTHTDFYDLPLKEVLKFYKTRGCCVQKDKGAILLTLPFPCPHLTPDGCAIYEKRPQCCREYNGIEDFGNECLWSTLKKQKSAQGKKGKD